MLNLYYSRLLFVSLFLLLSTLAVQAQQFRAEIQASLEQSKAKYKLTQQDISNWTVSDQYTNRKTGITHTYLQQQIGGISIFNAVSTMAIRQSKVVYFANRFHPDAASRSNKSTPVLSAGNAIRVAAADLGITLSDAPVLEQQEERLHRYIFSGGAISREPIQVDLFYVPVENAFHLAWNVTIAPFNSPDWWNSRVDAHSGRFIEKNNWTVHCDFGSGPQGSGESGSIAPPRNRAKTAQESGASASYLVYALPVEGPSFGNRAVLTDPNSIVASPYGWHDIDGVDGPEFTITRGNNVYAYEDRNNQNEPGYSPDGGPSLDFDFPIDLFQPPIINQDAIITNLFYVNNTVHDILYHHGFDEASGNYQANNYGRGGEGDDYVQAEAQDGGNTNNANFAAPPDGFNGRMQMYLWGDDAPPAVLTVNTPAGIAGNYVAVEAGFGPGLTTPISSDLVLVTDDTAPLNDGCDTITNAAAIAGKIAVVDRGLCSFSIKVSNIQSAGALAVIVCNNDTSDPISMGGSGSGITIPSVMISQADGDIIKAQINAGQTVNATLALGGGANVARDGSLDNGIIAHEYGHGLSIRLSGGPGNANCLNNAEQGGEGWSDWLGLILTIEPGDAGKDARPIGTYALEEPISGVGIRRYPYSTDMSINPQTYADLEVSPEVHDIGEIWSQVLWDMTWNLIDAEGFDSDWYNGSGGNITAMNLVVEAMKLQPCGPGYLDARDAILAADELLYNNAHRCMIWDAFARRGMGFDAVQGAANVVGDEIAGFALPNICLTATKAPVANFSVDTTISCSGAFRFIDLSTDIPQYYLWDFGDGNTSDEINPKYTYTVPGTFPVILTVTNTVGSSSDTVYLTFAPLAAPVVSGNTTVCAGGATTLTAAVTAGNTATWSDNGNILFTGTSFLSPSLAANTTYSVQQIENKPLLHVGPVDNTFAGGGNHNSGFDGRLLFEAYAPFRLLSVLVYAQGAGDRTISLYDAQGKLVQSVTVNLPDGASRIQLNMDIPDAGFYSLSNVSENLYRNNTGASYPYTINNLVRIYKSNATTDPLSFYYYFYDWEVQEKRCSSQPTTVNLNIAPGPLANFTSTANKLLVTFTDISTGNPGSWSWDFGDGAPLSTQQNPMHSFPAPGAYTVYLTVSNGSCSSVYAQKITVTDQSSGLYSVQNAFGLNVYPNPANQQVNLAFQRIPSGPVTVNLSDAGGRLFLSNIYEHPGNQITLNTSALAAGVYNLQVTGKEGSVVRKVILVK